MEDREYGLCKCGHYKRDHRVACIRQPCKCWKFDEDEESESKIERCKNCSHRRDWHLKDRNCKIPPYVCECKEFIRKPNGGKNDL